MKKNIHPKYYDITALCSCNKLIKIKSTFNKNLNLDVCSACHPFYTGKQRIADIGGRVDRFNKKFSVLIRKD